MRGPGSSSTNALDVLVPCVYIHLITQLNRPKTVSPEERIVSHQKIVRANRFLFVSVGRQQFGVASLPCHPSSMASLFALLGGANFGSEAM